MGNAVRSFHFCRRYRLHDRCQTLYFGRCFAQVLNGVILSRQLTDLIDGKHEVG